MDAMNNVIFTIGHSTHPIERFIALLRKHSITAVCDVRSHPYSRFNPQFNRELLTDALRKEGISYVYLGKELGARSDDPNCYRYGRVQYDLLASTEAFRSGLKRVRDGSEKFNVALMCAEKDPLQCHRTILVSRKLAEEGIEVRHILADGNVETHEQAVNRLLGILKLPHADLFRSRSDIVKEAYNIQGQAIAYEEKPEDAKSPF